MLTIATAYSKFILSGEHFVVDGTPSVVLPAPCFSTTVSIEDQELPGITAICNFDCPQAGLNKQRDKHESLVKDLIAKAAGLLGFDINNFGIRCVVRSTIPPGQGAGSSSSLCQAIVEAMIRHFLFDENAHNEKLHPNYLKWFGTQLENLWHGPVSGIDNAAIAYRRIMLYQRGQAPQYIQLSSPLFFVAGTTGPRTDRNPYEIMRNLRQKQPLPFAAYRKAMTENATQLAVALREGDLIQIGALMNESEDIFETCGIVTDSMKNACTAAASLGAFGARMTGAGGGGFVIACAPIHIAEKIQTKWDSIGLKAICILPYGLETIR